MLQLLVPLSMISELSVAAVTIVGATFAWLGLLKLLVFFTQFTVKTEDNNDSL